MVYPTLTPNTRKKMKHIHAELMLAYAQDAQETDAPWQRWENKLIGSNWNPCITHPRWDISYEYRRKPRTIRIGNYDVPEPLRVAPKVGSSYSAPCIGVSGSFATYAYTGDKFDLAILANGLMHPTPEAAELHAKALISLTEQ